MLRLPQTRVFGCAFACALALGALLAGPGLARVGSTPNFLAPDCPATLKGGAATLTPSLLSDATHTMKRYTAGGDTRGGEISCNYYDAATNNNFEWTLYYLFKTDTAAQVSAAIAQGYAPLGGWAHPAPAYCGVSKTTYAYVECNSTDADTVAGARGMLASAEGMSAAQLGSATTTTTTTTPTTSPGQLRLTQADLRRNKNYRAFFGLDDPRISQENLQIRSTSQCNSLVSRALHFPHVTSKTEIPGETVSGQHSASIFSDSDFHDLLDSSLPASSLKGNVFVEATQNYEPELRAAIASSGGNLQPADVLGLALDVTKGNYPLAVLTTLNLLKDVTFDGREAATLASRLVGAHPRSAAAIAKEHELYDKQIAIIEQQDAVVGKLSSLRANPLTAQDKMGPWYHAFTILTVGALYNAPIPKGLATAFWEHFRKLIGAFGNSEAPFNPEKATLDFCFAVATDSASLHGLAR